MTDSAEQVLERSTRDGVATLTLARPHVLNAMDDELGDLLLRSVREAGSDEEIRCIVVTGAGRAFSSGEDLAALSADYQRGGVPQLGQVLERRYNPLVRALRTAPKPTVAAVNGVAAGAGAALALACDFRVASEHAKLILGFDKVGLVPDSGSLWFLARMVGAARAWQLAVTGRVLSAADGLAWGLFDEVVEAEGFAARWTAFAAELASGPTQAYAITRRLLDSAFELPLDEQLDREIEAQTQAGNSADHLEGVRAFLDKRSPRFSGR